MGSGGNETRYHTRMRQVVDATFGTTTIATPHYEIWYDVSGIGGCHAVRKTINGVSGFDIATQRLYTTMSGAHANRYEWWGNTQNMIQSCNGRGAASNGYVRAFSISTTNH